MTAPVDICNRALSEGGTRTNISSLLDPSIAAVTCNLHYGTLVRQLHRTAPWGFCRRTVPLTLLGTLADGTAPYPFQYMYLYPPDAVKMRYLLPPPPTANGSAPAVSPAGMFYFPWCLPSRRWTFVVATNDVAPQGAGPPGHEKVILTNVQNALGIYNQLIDNPDQWDDLFEDAVVQALAAKIVIPLSGNIGLKSAFEKSADTAIAKARAADGNEAVATVDHTPDWIKTRGSFGDWSQAPWGGPSLGNWTEGWDSMSWSG